MMKPDYRTKTSFKILLTGAVFVCALTAAAALSRSQPEKPDSLLGWHAAVGIFRAPSMPLAPILKKAAMAPAGSKEKIPKVKSQSRFDKAAKPAAADTRGQEKNSKIPYGILRGESARLAHQEVRRMAPAETAGRYRAALELLDMTAIHTVKGDLTYQILAGNGGVRFQYQKISYNRIGHGWTLAKPQNLRGKTLRIDYRGYVPAEINFKIARSDSSAAVVKRERLEDSPYRSRSVLIEVPDLFPFQDVRQFEFWINRCEAGRPYGDFIILSVSVLANPEGAAMMNAGLKPGPYLFEQAFTASNLMRGREVPLS